MRTVTDARSYRVLPPITASPWIELEEVRLPEACQARKYAASLLERLPQAGHVQILPDPREATHCWRDGRLIEAGRGAKCPDR